MADSYEVETLRSYILDAGIQPLDIDVSSETNRRRGLAERRQSNIRKDGETDGEAIRRILKDWEPHLFQNTFGQYEAEVAAYHLISLAQRMGAWRPFTYGQINDLYQQSGKEDAPVCGRNFNFGCLVRGGFIIEAEVNGEKVFFFTKAFIERCYQRGKKSAES